MSSLVVAGWLKWQHNLVAFQAEKQHETTSPYQINKLVTKVYSIKMNILTLKLNKIE